EGEGAGATSKIDLDEAVFSGRASGRLNEATVATRAMTLRSLAVRRGGVAPHLVVIGAGREPLKSAHRTAEPRGMNIGPDPARLLDEDGRPNTQPLFQGQHAPQYRPGGGVSQAPARGGQLVVTGCPSRRLPRAPRRLGAGGR